MVSRVFCRIPTVPRALPAADEVHVWVAAVESFRSEWAALQTVLSPAESEAIAAYRQEADRDRRTAARGLLRHLLASYLAIAPGDVELVVTLKGKPQLAPKHSGVGLEFNVSHSGDFVGLAFAVRRRVGIDVEAVRPDAGGIELAESHFHPAEVEFLKTLEADQQLPGFFQFWTLKEAYLKALGVGLEIPLRDFAVAWSPPEGPRLSWIRGDPAEPERWSAWVVDLPASHRGAVIAEGRGLRFVHGAR